MDLTRVFPAETLADALEPWAWVGIGDQKPLFTSLFGDVFFRSADGIWLLDTLEGRFERIWDDAAALKAEVDTEEGADHYLLAGLAMAAYRAGIALGDDEIYAFKVPPVIGGGFDVSNLGAMSFPVILSILGQVHEQVRALPAGTEITRFPGRRLSRTAVSEAVCREARRRPGRPAPERRGRWRRPYASRRPSGREPRTPRVCRGRR